MNYLEDNSQHIAVIGLAGRFPRAKNVEEFWHNIERGIECITFFSDQEALSSGVNAELLRDPHYVKAHGVLEDIEMFSASFFGLSPREAALIDPQHRLFLECAWEALEHAGYAPESYKGRIGVYASTSSNTYLESIPIGNEGMNPLNEFQIMLGAKDDFLATRVSYKLNLRGPSMTVQTACSSSLVATHLAVQSLLNFESDMVLAGGVSIIVPQKYGYLYQEGSILSPDGHCRAFDAKAQGTVGGSGVGIVLLKRLAEAVEDGDTIHAIIRGSAINNDGSAKVGYTAPSIDGQAEVVAEALDIAGVDPDTVSYIETHGTGTPLGDPIEVAALTQAFRARTARNSFCAIGSVKTNIGHLDAAAGIAGLIKTVLALEHKILPPSLHFKQSNPNIDFTKSPFFVNIEAVPWQVTKYPRRAGVSSFGIGGTNAHIQLEEAPPRSPAKVLREQQILMLSAKTEAALETATDNLVMCLRQHPNLSLADIAYTLQVGRQKFEHRRALVCTDSNEAAALLANRDTQHLFTVHALDAKEPSLVLMFPGGDTQYPNMGRSLYETEGTFRREIDHCLELLQSLQINLRNFLYPDHSQTEEAVQQLRQSSLALPAIFITEYALAKLWMSWGIHPEAMIGHSFGEYVAACLSEVMSLEDALSVVVFRAQLVERLPKGAMLAVPLAMSELKPLLEKELSIATVNGPAHCVVSGPVEAVYTFERMLQSRGVETRRLHLDVAYHSFMLEPVLEEFKAFIKSVPLHPPTIPYISNVTGTWITAEDAINPDYWSKHMRQTVFFAEGIRELLREPSRIFLEVGPGRGLSNLVKLQMDNSWSRRVFSSLPPQRDHISEYMFLLHTLSHLWLQSIPIDWHVFHAHERRQRTTLPTYPFERQRYWLDSQKRVNKVHTPQYEKAEAPDILDQMYTSSWKQCLPLVPSSKDRADVEAYWVVLTAATDFELQIVKQFEQSGRRMISVTQGTRLSKQAKASYTINLQEYSDCMALFAELFSQNKKLPDKVLYLWSIAPPDQGSAVRDFSNMLVLFQVLEELQLHNSIEVIVVSSQSLAFADEDITYSEERGLLVGLCDGISRLASNVVCRIIDIPSLQKGGRELRLIDKLLTEISLEATATTQHVAYRGGSRWTLVTESLNDLGVREQETGVKLQMQGVYLIFGGLEVIGFQFACYIAQQMKVIFILQEEAAFPASTQWDTWLVTYGAEDPISREIHRIRLLEEAHAEVHVFRTDTERHYSQTKLMHVLEQYSNIHGVFYQIGSSSGKQSSLSETNSWELQQHLRSEILQLRDLEHVLQNASLDFCFISSTSQATQRLVQVIDATMSRQVEAFIHRHNYTHSIAWSSVHWDSSCFEGKRRDSLSSNITQVELVITRQALGDIFRQLLSIGGASQITISMKASGTGSKEETGDILQSINAEIHLDETSEYTSTVSESHTSHSNEIEAAVANIWKEVLGVEQVNMRDDFFMIGGDSLLAAQLTARLRDAFLLDVPLQSVFVNPTIVGLAATIEELFLDSVEGMSDEEAQQFINNGTSGEF